MSSRRQAAAASPRAAAPTTAYVLAPTWAPAGPPQPALSYPASYSWYPQQQQTVTSVPPAALMHRVDARWAQTWGAWLPQAHQQVVPQAPAYATYGVPTTAQVHHAHANVRHDGASSPTRSPFGPAPPALAPAPAHPHAAAARPSAPAKRPSHDSGHGTSLSLSPPPLPPRAAPSSLPGMFAAAADDDDDDGLAELLRGCSMPPMAASPRPVSPIPAAPVIDASASAVATAALASLDLAGLDAGAVAALAALDADVDAAVLAGWWAAVTGLDPATAPPTAAADAPVPAAPAPAAGRALDARTFASVVPPPWRPTPGPRRGRAFPSIRAALAAVSVPVARTKRKREVDDELDELLRSVVPPPLRRAPMTARPVGRSV
ncbi:hypothetical protein GGF31_006390 [Allomyces arbusculus]|nr:hypothetical protein GGF31_006390 [Allomyces arbusculus]